MNEFTSSVLLSPHAWLSHAMSHADKSLRRFAACDCRGIRRMWPRLPPSDCKPAHIGGRQSRPRMAHCYRAEKEAFSRRTAVCRENAPFSAIKESHIMYRTTV